MARAASLVLASASGARSAMLANAGVSFLIDPASVDEGALKAAARQQGKNSAETALALATIKAETVSARHPRVLVIGADQVLECEGQWFDKPADREDAAATLSTLRGRTHVLTSGVAVACDGVVRWSAVEAAALTMRGFSDRFLDQYLDEMGDSVRLSVGGYRLEGRGVQLFSRIEGDYFTVLGMPLLPLLKFLRDSALLED